MSYRYRELPFEISDRTLPFTNGVILVTTGTLSSYGNGPKHNNAGAVEFIRGSNTVKSFGRVTPLCIYPEAQNGQSSNGETELMYGIVDA